MEWVYFRDVLKCLIGRPVNETPPHPPSSHSSGGYLWKVLYTLCNVHLCAIYSCPNLEQCYKRGYFQDQSCSTSEYPATHKRNDLKHKVHKGRACCMLYSLLCPQCVDQGLAYSRCWIMIILWAAPFTSLASSPTLLYMLSVLPPLPDSSSWNVPYFITNLPLHLLSKYLQSSCSVPVIVVEAGDTWWTEHGVTYQWVDRASA